MKSNKSTSRIRINKVDLGYLILINNLVAVSNKIMVVNLVAAVEVTKENGIIRRIMMEAAKLASGTKRASTRISHR